MHAGGAGQSDRKDNGGFWVLRHLCRTLIWVLGDVGAGTYVGCGCGAGGQAESESMWVHTGRVLLLDIRR